MTEQLQAENEQLKHQVMLLAAAVRRLNLLLNAASRDAQDVVLSLPIELRTGQGDGGE